MENNNKMPDAVIFFADGFEEVEAIATLDILRRAGVRVLTVSINETETVTSARGLNVMCDAVYSDDCTAIDGARMLILPGGGVGTKNLKAQVKLADKIIKFNEQGKLLAAICAAPSIFDGLGILHNRKATCFPGVVLADANTVAEDVCVDGNIITAKAAGVTHKFAAEIVKMLKDEQTAEKVLAEMFY